MVTIRSRKISVQKMIYQKVIHDRNLKSGKGVKTQNKQNRIYEIDFFFTKEIS